MNEAYFFLFIESSNTTFLYILFQLVQPHFTQILRLSGLKLYICLKLIIWKTLENLLAQLP